MSNWTDSSNKSVSDYDPYQRQYSETAKIFFDILLLLFGGPLNVIASLRLYKAFRVTRRTRKRQATINFLLLKTNLHISDLIIIFVHLPIDIGWQVTISWDGGDALCKFYKFISIFAFHLSSFAVLSIAAERTLTVRRIMAASQGRQTGRSRFLKTSSVKVFLVGTWLVAAALSLPQVRAQRLKIHVINHLGSPGQK